MDDLVKQLRLRASHKTFVNSRGTSWEEEQIEAADRIEAQAAEIERLRSRDWVGDLLRWESVNPGCENLFVGQILGGHFARWQGEYHIGTAGKFLGKVATEAEARTAVEKAVREALGVPATSDPFQARVQPWMMECFGAEISADKVERGDRLLEEVFELLQSVGYDPARALSLRDYVWRRPAGDPPQETGGVMVTLAAFCLAHDLDMHQAGEVELARISQPKIVLKIRAKQAAKPTGSALPIAMSSSEPVRTCETCRWDIGRYHPRCEPCLGNVSIRDYPGWTAKTTASEEAAP